jgi:hypothetical protein
MKTGLAHSQLTLTSGEGTDHDQSSAHTGEETLGTELAGHLDETRGCGLSRCALGLVDLGKKGVGGLRDDGSGHTGDKTGTEVKTSGLATREGLLGSAQGLQDLLGSDLEAISLAGVTGLAESKTYTANLAIVYGTCLNRMGPKPA